MSNIKARLDKLHVGTISHVSCRFQVYKDNKMVIQKTHGTNKNKVVCIIIRL